MSRSRLATLFQHAGMGLLATGVLTAATMQVGCETMKKKDKKAAVKQQLSIEEQQMAQLVREQAQRLEMLHREEQLRKLQPEMEVTWLDGSRLLKGDEQASSQHPAVAKAPPPAVSSNAAVASDGQAPTTHTGANAAADSSKQASADHPGDQPVTLASAGRDQLVNQLLHELRHQQGDAMGKAMNVSLLLGLAGKTEIEADDLASLSDAQKQRVRQFHTLATLLREQALSPAGAAHYQAIMDHLDALLAEVPLHIRKVELSRSVSSFGVMDPMESHTFLAGRNVPMIVYVELEHFKAIKGDQGKYTVKLAQELVLYNEADGLAVWREPKVQIVDESLNRRRDFFVVQRVELPARLSVGKYLLKVTMTDLQGGSIDETSIPIQIVADPSLVKKD